MMKWKKHFTALMVLTALFWMTESARIAAAAALDQNEEIQNVMGDLSALKTATQMYFSENANSSRVPPLSSILHYFDESSVPPDASLLYSIRGDSGGWYVGYRSSGLRGVTHRQLEENAVSLGIVGDDLRSPWRHGSTFIWASALALGAPSGRLVIRESRSNTPFEFAKILVGMAAIVNVVNDRHHVRHNYYSHPGQLWRWRSSLIYRPLYRDRFYTHFSRPPAYQSVRPAPPVRREPPPARRPDNNRRADNNRNRLPSHHRGQGR